MLFDTKHVEIGPKMAEIVQIAWKLREICMKLCEEVREIAWKYHQRISRLEYMLFDAQHVEIGPKMAEIAQIVWKLREIAWRGAWNCVKVLPMNFSAWVHAFWYPTCSNWPKNGWNSQNCVKIPWNCVNTRVKFFETRNIACPRRYGSNGTSGFPNGHNRDE